MTNTKTLNGQLDARTRNRISGRDCHGGNSRAGCSARATVLVTMRSFDKTGVAGDSRDLTYCARHARELRPGLQGRNFLVVGHAVVKDTDSATALQLSILRDAAGPGPVARVLSGELALAVQLAVPAGSPVTRRAAFELILRVAECPFVRG